MKPIWHEETWLQRRFVVQGWTITAMAKEAGVSRTAVSNALRKHGVIVPAQAPPFRKGEPVCTQDCPYWEGCLDWPADKACPMETEE